MGFVSKRGRFVLLRGRKADIMHELLYFLFQLLMVVVVLIALMQYTNNVAKDLGFEKRFTSIDMALFTTAVTYAPGTLKQVYDPLIFKVAVDASFANSVVSITEKGSKLAPVVFWFLSDRNLEVMRGEGSLKATAVNNDSSSGSYYIPPNFTYYRTGGIVSLSEKENNALRLVCPTVDTFASDWKSKKVFIAKVLSGQKNYSDTKLPINRLANALSTRYSQFSLSGAVKDASAQDGKLISAIPSNVELIIAIGDSGEKREKGSLVAYIPADSNLLKARKLACFIINDLLTPETTVYYAQVMPIFPESINKTSPLRVFKEVSDNKQVIVFLDISTFSESEISIENTADAIYRAIERYYGGYDVKAVSGATLTYSASGIPSAAASSALQPAGSSSSAAKSSASASAQASSSVSSGSCPARIVAVGDSLTAGSSYVAYLRKLCGTSTTITNEDGDSSTSQVWTEIKAGKPRDRISHESKTTKWMLDDFDSALSSDLNADMIIVFGGGNDVASSRSYVSITSNLEAMYSKARAAGKKVVAVTMIRGPGATVAAQLETKKKVNQWILTESSADIKVNAYDLFVAPGSDTGNAAYFGSDLSHPNSLGKEVIAKAIYAAITGNSQGTPSAGGSSSTEPTSQSG